MEAKKGGQITPAPLLGYQLADGHLVLANFVPQPRHNLMEATLYLPDQPPQAVSTIGLSMPDPVTGFARVPDEVPVLMGCSSGLVDVQVCQPGCVAYSVFDYEGPVNYAAMTALAELTGVVSDIEDEDAVLCGPILVVTEESGPSN